MLALSEIRYKTLGQNVPKFIPVSPGLPCPAYEHMLLNIRAKYCFLRANSIYYNCQQKGVDCMAGNTTNISIRMDADLKAQADALFAELGMNLSTAFNIFVRQSLREGGIPFEVKLEQPNKETIAAMLEAERIAKDPSVKGCNDLDELFADLKK